MSLPIMTDFTKIGLFIPVKSVKRAGLGFFVNVTFL